MTANDPGERYRAQHDPGLSAARERMLELLRRQIRDEKVIAAMSEVPRERFVPAAFIPHAYDDRALSIGEGQTISQPLIVALMTEALSLRERDRVLEVGTGSGYQAAVLSRLVREVISVERITALGDAARSRLADLGYGNVELLPAGVRLGLPERAPFDAIVVTAAAPHVPRSLIEQLADHGRLVAPVGGLRVQELIRVTTTSHGAELERLGSCAFVPLIGEEGWTPEIATLR